MIHRPTLLIVPLLTLFGAGALVAGCSSNNETLSQQVRNWASTTGWTSALATLTGDLGRVSSVASDSPGVRHTVCDVLVTDALNDNQQLPTPDRSLTQLLSRAYTAAANAGRDCYAGGTRLASAPPEQRQAQRLLVQAQARYDTVVSSLAIG
ncbi:MAG TPA: hypothetical protein VK386_09825 [Acidimicrobiales bacterium]|nr:hypothetical protein [Acidimicrobiales bacterium]